MAYAPASRIYDSSRKTAMYSRWNRLLSLTFCVLSTAGTASGASLVENYELVSSSEVQPIRTIRSPSRKRRLGGYKPPDDSDVDCALLSPFLQSMYPHCADSDDEEEMDPDHRPDDEGIRKSLVPYSLTVAIKNRILSVEETRYVRYVVTKAVSKAMKDNSPFYVPKPRRSEGGSSSSDDGSGQRRLERRLAMDEETRIRLLMEEMITWEEEDTENSASGDEDPPSAIATTSRASGGGGSGGSGGGGGSSGGGSSGSGGSGGGSSGSDGGGGGGGSGVGGGDGGERPPPPPEPEPSSEATPEARIWLWRFFTSAGSPIVDDTTNNQDDVVLYPIKIEFVSWWRKKNESVQKRRVISEIRKVCFDVCNRVIRNGELHENMMGSIQWHLDHNIKPDDTAIATWLVEEGNIFFMDPAEDSLPTYLYALDSDWGRREWVGALLFFLTLTLSWAMFYFSVAKTTTESPVMEGSHLLTEEGVRNLLTVGWRYEGEKDGDQLFLKVYDKSNVGYKGDDDSVLMGGVEKLAIAEDQAAPAALTDSTDPTEQDSATVTNRTNGGDGAETTTNRQHLSASFTTTSSREDTDEEHSSDDKRIQIPKSGQSSNKKGDG